MKRLFLLLLLAIAATTATTVSAQQRRPIDNEHPLWLVHIDVWNTADPQKIIDLVPEDVRPYVCMNLSLSCQYDKVKKVYKMPQNAMRTYRSWASVCQANGLWFTCQPASGGHTHLEDGDLESFEYMFRRYPNFLGWNFAEQFWGFDEKGDLSSSTQTSRWALFAKLVEMSHNYGGLLTISFCGNIWSHPLNPIGEMKRNADFLKACRKYPESILWLYKYTTSACFYNNESVTFGPFIGGLAKNYGVRYDNCGWNGAMDDLVGSGKAKYPACAGVGTVMEQCGTNGGAVWDGPELIWNQECFTETNRTTVDGYTRRNWKRFDNMNGVWIDMFRKIIDGTIYIPTREEVIADTKIVLVNNNTSGNDEDKYAAPPSLFDGLYKQDDDPANARSSYGHGQGQMMSNYCYFKKTGRYGTIPVVPELYDDLAKSIPVQVKRTQYITRWSNLTKKTNEFNTQYPEISTGDLFVRRMKNQLVCYTPYTYLNKKTQATGQIPLQYNTCESLTLTLGKIGSATVREFSDHLDFYFNNFRTDTTALVTETIAISGVTAEPTYTYKNGTQAKGNATAAWDAETGTYTLTLKHIGGANVTINCAGNATGREADVHPIAALPTPVQPAEYHGEIIAEAEDMDIKNVKNCTTSPYNSHPSVRGHAANGFVEMGTSTAGALRHFLTVKEAGDYRISVRYMNTAKSGQLRAAVNGKTTMVDVEKTASNEWRKATFDATLKAGKNTLVITNLRGIALMIDQVIYTPADCEPEKFLITVRKANYGSMTPDVEEAAEGQTVTMTITANNGYGLKELKVINGVNYTWATTLSLETLANGNTKLTFTMPDDIVTLQPVFAKGINVVDGIDIILPDEEQAVNGNEAEGIYDINGRQLPTLRPGLNIVRTANGKTLKLMKR